MRVMLVGPFGRSRTSMTAFASSVQEPSGLAPATLAGWRATSDWYHAYFTGLILSTVVRCGADAAEELVCSIFTRQREERFLPGLRKLGLDRLPHAVAAAQYHYLSNAIGGVSVQYMPESDRKAWVRYVPPRWIWAGTAICAVPSKVSAAMLRGWHAQNGVSLGNPRLGFVCTKQTVDGDAALEGYYFEYDRELAPDERLRFARDEDGPDFDPALAPSLPAAGWPLSRLEKARRNYAMEYVRTSLPSAVRQLGERAGGELLRLTGRLIGMQHYRAVQATLAVADGHAHATAPVAGANASGASNDGDDARGDARASAERFAAFVRALGEAQDDEISVAPSGEGVVIEQRGWKLFERQAPMSRAVFEGWNGLYEGALAAIDHRLVLNVQVFDAGSPARFVWTVGRRTPR
jgi:hypothetical protein